MREWNERLSILKHRFRQDAFGSTACRPTPSPLPLTIRKRRRSRAWCKPLKPRPNPSARLTHHFRVLQCPMNLFEAGAATDRQHRPVSSDRARICAPKQDRGVGEPAVECHGGSKQDVAAGRSPARRSTHRYRSTAEPRWARSNRNTGLPSRRPSRRPEPGRHRPTISIGPRNCAVFIRRFRGSNIGNRSSTT